MAENYVAVLDLSRMDAAGKMSQARHSADCLTDHISIFATPSPTPAALRSQADLLQTAEQKALGGGEEARQLFQQEEANMDNCLRGMQRYVNQIAAGSKLIITQAGMRPSRDRVPAQRLPAPTNGRVTGMEVGKVKIIFDTAEGMRACNWLLYVGTTAPADLSDYTHMDGTTTSYCTFEGLPSGQSVWVCCAVIGTKGQSAWSDPATRTIM